MVPESFKSDLKYIKIEEFKGHRRELKVVALFLEQARILKRMTIVSSSSLSEDLDMKREVEDQLIMLPRGSASCDVEFY